MAGQEPLVAAVHKCAAATELPADLERARQVANDWTNQTLGNAFFTNALNQSLGPVPLPSSSAQFATLPSTARAPSNSFRVAKTERRRSLIDDQNDFELTRNQHLRQRFN
jgi:hypothetical protein